MGLCPHAEEVAVETNELERRRWNDAQWAEVWPKRERMTDAVTAFLLDAAALARGERVLDIGCGGGKTSLAAAQAVGDEGAVVGADISRPLVALATRRAAEAGAANATFRDVDMQTDTVDGGPFDIAISQFGVMFFDEPDAAFANIRAHLRPGGRLAFACWQVAERNPWFFAPAIAAFLPPPPAPAPGKSPTGPFVLGDPDHTAETLRSAGFEDVGWAAHDIEVEVPQDAIVDAGQLTFMGIAPDQLADARDAVDRYMEQFAVSPTILRIPLAFQVFWATTA
jgi:SAM-dependent methyltransferase